MVKIYNAMYIYIYIYIYIQEEMVLCLSSQAKRQGLEQQSHRACHPIECVRIFHQINHLLHLSIKASFVNESWLFPLTWEITFQST